MTDTSVILSIFQSPTLTCIIISGIIAWVLWVTNMLFTLKSEQKVTEVHYQDLKDDLKDLTIKIDKLIEIQNDRHRQVDAALSQRKD